MAYSKFEAGNGRTAVLTDFACPKGEMSLSVRMSGAEGGGGIRRSVPVSLLEDTIGFGEAYGRVRIGSLGEESLMIVKSGSDDEYAILFPVIAKDEPALVMKTADYLAFVREALGGKSA